MAGTERGVMRVAGGEGSPAGAGSTGGGTGLRVAGPVRPVAERVGVRPVRTGGPGAGAPPLRRDPTRPGGRAVRPEPRPVRGSRSRSDAARRSEPAAAPLRLTRRGWCALTTLLVAAAALAVLVLSALLGGGEELELAGGSSVVVRPGDTVWSIATTVADDGEDVRAVVDAIGRLNDLEGSAVVPGQVLELP
ncbi:LysM peptidoglycan-binding domain-containing protein [Blastococcus sp. TF02A-26]|uniref:LysM peptidoglycan-binding domain-containing protein n=1 Tax=Blastococcus sp. TF02A-26 TaxID=2250577 RepID=UPI000DEA7514|nr:LysM peptidoglycan-binding domain-containing protein [Blastococcus sp. TF02A-26]RBY85180.1 hypothetical protein DQ240_13230 [Blastococcus sp. TF02A-26]